MADLTAIKMDCSTSKTPQKSPEATGVDSNLGAVFTPVLRSKRASTSRGLLMDPRTPNNISSPPAKRFHRVRNPFEAATAERLLLPMIASPSLFQRPATPQFSSTQFEWTIEEVSSLRPVHLEPHETQFQDSPNPEYEAKAQSAISSYFKDQVIVPSPVDCPLRKQRIIMCERNGQTPITKSKLRHNMRDCAVQTMLSLPPILPPGLEEVLRPYFQPQLAICSSTLVDADYSDSSLEANNMSLRRKLFDLNNVILLDGQKAMNDETATSVQSQNTSSPVSPVPVARVIMGKLSDSYDKNSFGSLSPISNRGGISFTSHSSDDAIAAKLSRRNEFMQDMEMLSPIQCDGKAKDDAVKPMRKSRSLGRLNYRSQCDTTDGLSIMDDASPKMSPEPVYLRELSLSPAQESSFGVAVSELVNSFERATTASCSEGQVKPNGGSLKGDEDTVDINDLDDDDMQVTFLSQQSFDCSTSTINSDTPRSSGRRSAIRKNLSQSLTSANWFELELHANDAAQQEPGVPSEANGDAAAATTAKEADVNVDSLSPVKRLVFYRTDSGFNEMTTSNALPAGGLNMGCCSTPSKRSVN